jgi:tetratricopeptide (TPR) repeat protein
MRFAKGRGLPRFLLSLIAALVLLPMAAWAGLYEDADAAYRRGDYRTSVTLLQQAQQENPNEIRVYAALGKSYRKLGDNNAAREAYTEFLRRDPDLRTLKNNTDRQNFLAAFRSIGGQIPARRPEQGGQDPASVSPSDIIAALNSGNVYVVPTLRKDIDSARLESVAASFAPNKAKILVTRQLGGYKTREELATALGQALNLGKYDTLLVITPRGVSAYAPRFSTAEITDILRNSKVESLLAQQPTEAAAVALQSIASASKGAASGDTNKTTGFFVLLAAGAGGFFLYRAAKAKKAMADARAAVEPLRQKVLADLAYVDGYLDLLPKSDPNTTQAKQLRASAFEKYDTATGFLKTAKNPTEVRHAEPLLKRASDELLECRKAIDLATGGTGVAMGLLETPDLDTDIRKAEKFRKAEELRTEEERRLMQEEIEQVPVEERGVSFFSGQPMPASQLVPVTIVIQGRRRTVMATPEEAAAIARGETPSIRVFQDPVTRRNVPWYENRNYDPYRDYYGYGPTIVFVPPVFVPIYDVTYDYGPAVYDHYGGWGYGGYGWGMPEPPGGVYTHDPGQGGWGGQGGYVQEAPPEHAGGFDFFGQQGYNEQGPGFDSGDSGDSGSSWFGGDSSGFDNGSSWSSSDSGSSWDSGSSSSDSGSSSDFGGSSDW